MTVVMADSDYVTPIYEFLRSHAETDSEGRLMTGADIHPWLMADHGLNTSDARRIRTKSVKDLERRGLVLRHNPPAGPVEILSEAPARRLPDWSMDELMLALDLYLRTRGEISYSPRTQVVVDLSDELRSLTIFPLEVRSAPRFRNPAGVALKLHNFSANRPGPRGRWYAARCGRRPGGMGRMGPPPERTGCLRRRDTGQRGHRRA